MIHFTYKITFPGMPWFYYGVHTKTGKPYFGSPKTHAWRWKMYDHEIQILEWFEDRREAELVEDRIIKHFIDEPNCLNEHYGGYFPEESRKIGSERSNALDSENRKEAGRLMAQRNIESGKQKEFARLGGLAMRGIPKNLSDEEKKKRAEAIKKVTTNESCRNGGVAAQKLRFRCLETGYVSNAGGLSQYQKARGIDTSRREVYEVTQDL
jgi:hypothetical protein